MKKSVIALLLSVVLAVGSNGATSVSAMEASEETTAEEALVVEEESVAEEVFEEIEDANTGMTDEDEAQKEYSQQEEAVPSEGIEEEFVNEQNESADTAVTENEEKNYEESEDANSLEENVVEPVEIEDELVIEEDTETVEEKEAVQAVNIVDSGTCGDNVTWTVTGEKYDYSLFISGTGEMYDYGENSNLSPWSTYKDDIYNVIVEEDITSIGAYAFYFHKNIENVSLPDSITSINPRAFCYCYKMSNINIPSSIEYIGEGSFNMCEVLDLELNFPDSLVYLGENAFAGCKNVSCLRIPNSITEISEGVFRYCSGITSLVIPDNITNIGNYAFENLGTKDLIIPGTVDELGVAAFRNASVVNVEISEGVKSIGAYCFANCKYLEHIAIPNGITEIQMSTFEYCSSLDTLEIPYGVTDIGNSAIPYSMKYLKLPETVTHISGSNASSEKTNYLYYGTEKQWNHVDNHGYYKNLYIITTPVTGVEFERTEYIVGINNKLIVQADLIPQNPSCDIIDWEIEDKSIAEIYWLNSRECTVTGRKTGTTVLKCVTADGNYTTSCRIKVVSQQVTGINMPDNDSELSVGVGLSKQIQANVLPENADNQNIVWSSSDPGIVTVNNDGTVTGVGKGTATITAMTEEGEYTATRNVSTYIPVSEIKLSEESIVLATEESSSLSKYTVIYAEISPEDVDDGQKNLKWDTTTKDVVYFRYFYDHDPQGCLVYAKNPGKTTIEVSTEDGSIKKYIDVSVVIPVQGVSFLYSSIYMHVGEDINLSPNFHPNSATNQKVTWSSSNEEVATIDENGKVTALKLGETTITAVTEEGGYSASCEISVIVPVTGVELEKANISLRENETETLNAIVSPEDAGYKAVVWSSSDNSVASVNYKGIITAKKAGTATITAKTSDGGYKASCRVTVNHAWNNNYTVDEEASCTAEGSESIHCSVCNAIDDTTIRSIPKKEHNYEDWTVTSEPTCTEEGSKEKVCADCGDVITETIPANGHTWSDYYTVDKEATCTEEGSESIHCSVCDTIDETTIRAILMKEHDYGDWIITKGPTCTEEGNREKKCVNCGDSVTEVIPANGHSWNEAYTIDVESTCAKEGSESIHCSVCNAVNETTVRAIEKKEHIYGEWTVTKRATCTGEGSRKKNCTNCGDTVTEVIPAAGHQWDKDYSIDKAASCAEEGVKSIHCSVCDAVDETTIRAIAKKEHNYGDWNVIKEPTCTEKGNREKICIACGDVVTDPIPASGHTWNKDYTIDKEPTNTEEGSKSIHCSVCDAVKEGSEVIIQKLAKELGEVTITGIVNKTYTGKEITQNIVINDDGKTLKAGTDYTVAYENNVLTGTAAAIITGIGSYTGTVTKNFLILPGKTTRGDMFNLANNVKVTWKEAPGAKYYKVYREGITDGEESLEEPVIVTTGLIGWDKQPGLTNGHAYRYKIVASLTGKGDSSGDSTLSYSKVMYRLKTVVIRSVKNTAPGKVTVKYDKTTSGDSYVLQYCEREDMIGAKTKVVLGADNTSYTIGGLKKGKTYYISIRVRKKVNGIDYYTTFGVAKKITVTK